MEVVVFNGAELPPRTRIGYELTVGVGGAGGFHSTRKNCGIKRLRKVLVEQGDTPKAGHGSRAAVKLKPGGEEVTVNSDVLANEAGTVFEESYRW